MTELEQLVEQKKQIEKRIRELRNTEFVSGIAKFDRENHRGSFNYRVCAETYAYREQRTGGKRFSALIRTDDKDFLLTRLQLLIDSLTDLKKQLEENVI